MSDHLEKIKKVFLSGDIPQSYNMVREFLSREQDKQHGVELIGKILLELYNGLETKIVLQFLYGCGAEIDKTYCHEILTKHIVMKFCPS